MAAKVGNHSSTPSGRIRAGYRLSGDGIDATKPTVVLIDSMCTTSSLFNAQFNSKSPTEAFNLLAIEPLGHGAISSVTEHFHPGTLPSRNASIHALVQERLSSRNAHSNSLASSAVFADDIMVFSSFVFLLQVKPTRPHLQPTTNH